MALSSEDMRALIGAGLPDRGLAAVADLLGEKGRARLNAAWRRATKDARRCVQSQFTAHTGGTMFGSQETEARAAREARQARGAARKADSAQAQIEAEVAQRLKNLSPEELALLIDELNEVLEAMGILALTGPEDSKVAKAFLVALTAAKAAGVKDPIPEFTEPGQNMMALGAIRAILQHPLFQEYLENAAPPGGEAGEPSEVEDAAAVPGKKRDNMALFASRVK